VIRDLLRKAVASVEDAVSGAFVTRAQHAFSDLKLSDKAHDDGAAAATRYLRQLDTVDKKVMAFPGKQLFGEFVSLLQKEHGVNLRVEDVIARFDTDNTPKELVDCLNGLKDALIEPSGSSGPAGQLASDGNKSTSTA